MMRSSVRFWLWASNKLGEVDDVSFFRSVFVDTMELRLFFWVFGKWEGPSLLRLDGPIAGEIYGASLTLTRPSPSSCNFPVPTIHQRSSPKVCLILSIPRFPPSSVHHSPSLTSPRSPYPSPITQPKYSPLPPPQPKPPPPLPPPSHSDPSPHPSAHHHKQKHTPSHPRSTHAQP